jgi:hypothetical protein
MAFLVGVSFNHRRRISMTTPIPIPDLPAPDGPPPDAFAAPKWWGHSLTVWGALITALTTVVPAMGPVFGINITADLIQQLGQSVVIFAQALGGLVGTVMAIYGRIRATAPIERRQFTLTM